VRLRDSGIGVQKGAVPKAAFMVIARNVVTWQSPIIYVLKDCHTSFVPKASLWDNDSLWTFGTAPLSAVQRIVPSATYAICGRAVADRSCQLFQFRSKLKHGHG